MPTWRTFSMLPLRIMLAVGFLYHGLPKFTAAGHQSFTDMVAAIGLPAPELMAWLVAVLEVGGALLLLVGFLTRFTSALLIVEMAVAMFAVHLPFGFSFLNITGMTDVGPVFGMPGIEVNLLYISMLTALLIGGPGSMSVDASRHAELVVAEPAMRERQPIGV